MIKKPVMYREQGYLANTPSWRNSILEPLIMALLGILVGRLVTASYLPMLTLCTVMK